MHKENTQIYIIMSKIDLEFRYINSNQLCDIQTVEKSDFEYNWTEFIE